MGVVAIEPASEEQCKEAGKSSGRDTVRGKGHDGDAHVIRPLTVPEYDNDSNGRNLSRGVSTCGQIVISAEGVNGDIPQYLEPHDRMEYESKEEAFSFYKDYAKSMGFAAVIKASRRSRVSGKFIDAKFACSRYGNKREPTADITAEPASGTGNTMVPARKKCGRINVSWSKTDCKACMHVKRGQDGKWVIRSFIKEHNHEISPDQAYYFRDRRTVDLGHSHREAMRAIRARTEKNVYTSGQSVGLKKLQNQKGCVATQPNNDQLLRLDEQDAQLLLDHFVCMQEQNPHFFYAIDLDQQQLLRNVFWVDAKGRIDYGNFGDVVFFDITYIKNEYRLPFAPFIGVNHHCQCFLLGCALLADETRSTYVWLMRAWLRAMGGRAPQVIITDQEDALKEAIAEVLPESRHCFCLWHILSKVPEKLSDAMRQDGNFMKKFNKCVSKSCSSEQFEKRWRKMVNGFNLGNNAWFRSLYEDRRGWVPTYMKDLFLAGMSTAHRADSMSSFLDKYVLRKTTVKEFLEQYNILLQEKSEEEAKADFETWHKQPGLKSPSPFGKQMAAIYTHAIFKKFQVEVLGVVACHPRKDSEDGEIKSFRVQDFEENRDLIVVRNERTSELTCSCRLFELHGFLCRHVMIVLQISGVHIIPSQYILRRWTKDAKSREFLLPGSSAIPSQVQRYNNLCQQAFRLGDEGSLSQDSYAIALAAFGEALRTCETISYSIQSVHLRPSPSHDLQDLDDVNKGSRTTRTDDKNSSSEKGKEPTGAEFTVAGHKRSWHEMGPSTLHAPAVHCSDNQECVQGMGQLIVVAANCEDRYSGQHVIRGLSQPHYRSQALPSCFDAHGGLRGSI